MVHPDDNITTLTTARNAVDGGKTHRPCLPGHSGRGWALANTAQDSTTYAYALIAWDNDDPTDYWQPATGCTFPAIPPAWKRSRYPSSSTARSST